MAEPDGVASPDPGAKPRPALALHGADFIAWAVFDPDWYARHYAAAGGLSGEDMLQFHLREGQQQGHSPNRFFDETCYRARYPGVAAGIAAGTWASGFDHYCAVGLTDHAPHWLYDDGLYCRRYEDLSDAALAKAGLINRYDHYLKHGNQEGRIAHRLFDPAYCRAALPDAQAAGPFVAYLDALDHGHEAVTSRHFDPLWYRSEFPDIAAAIDNGTWEGALHHYLTNPSPSAFDPLPQFSEREYRARYPDVAAAIASGVWRNGYHHFLQYGAAELRAPRQSIDLRRYVERHPSVAADIERGAAPDAFTHLLAIGQPAGLSAAAIATPGTPIAQSPRDTRAEMLLSLCARDPLRFEPAGTPALSVAVIWQGDLARLLLTLASLRDTYAEPIELVIVEAGGDMAVHGPNLARCVQGARVLPIGAPISVTAACNAALISVTTPAILFLASGLELAHNAVANAVRRLGSDATIGAVGGLLLGADGAVQEAGGLVWRDGSLSHVAAGLAAQSPEANLRRDVDWCSASFLMIRTELLRGLDGFDTALPSDAAAADLGLRIARAGSRTVYDPGCMAEAADRPAGVGLEPIAEFAARHFNHLLARPTRDTPEAVARLAVSGQRRILFIEDRVPLRALGSGFVRSNDLVRMMDALGYAVTIAPLRPAELDAAAQAADLPDTVEVLHDRGLGELPALLRERTGLYDVIWITRTHNVAAVQAMLPTGPNAPRIVLDTEAVVSLREAAKAALTGETFDLDAALDAEFAPARAALGPTGRLVTVTQSEADVLARRGLPKAAILGHACRPQPTPREWELRSGMLFLGAMHEVDSPNVDGLAWFVEHVLPLVEQALGWQTRLTVAGFVGSGVDLSRFGAHPRVTLRGPVTDTTPLYDVHRVFVAPTRYAAGLPYKLHEAASRGLPIVASDLLRLQLGWPEGEAILSAPVTDPAAFAAHIVRLERNRSLWESLRGSALAKVTREGDPAFVQRRLGAILDGGVA